MLIHDAYLVKGYLLGQNAPGEVKAAHERLLTLAMKEQLPKEEKPKTDKFLEIVDQSNSLKPYQKATIAALKADPTGTRKRPSKWDDREAEVRKLYLEDKMSDAEIGILFDVSGSMITSVRKRYGISHNTKKEIDPSITRVLMVNEPAGWEKWQKDKLNHMIFHGHGMRDMCAKLNKDEADINLMIKYIESRKLTTRPAAPIKSNSPTAR